MDLDDIIDKHTRPDPEPEQQAVPRCPNCGDPAPPDKPGQSPPVVRPDGYHVWCTLNCLF